MMDIVHKKDTWEPTFGTYKNCIVLYDDNWNDYCYTTTFHAVYCNEHGKSVTIGDVKIYYYDFDKKRTETYGRAVSSVIDKNIIQLSEKFCSLGQTLNYYQRLKNNCPNDYLDILNRLNDIAINPELRERFIKEDGVQTSLLRESSAEKALNEAATLLETDQLNQKDVSFSYFAKVPYNDDRKQLTFDFQKSECFPYRINALIGKNGVGKTQILSNLAESLSGLTGSVSEKTESFKGKRPPVDKVISVSYSAFDEFRKRVTENEKYSENSYAYCGVQSDHGTLSLQELKRNFIKALGIIRQRERLESWKSIMQELIEKEHIDLIERAANGEIDSIHWSSGQYILLCTMTEVIATIEKESLLLFDEPELHLHPNAVANTLRMLYRLLEEFDSYAIFATHSPLIVQEIPSRYVQILSRVDNVLMVRRPTLECFGENVTNITNDIFDVNGSESNYKTILKKLSTKMSFDDVVNAFDGALSFNAMIYLKGCYKDE